MKTNKLTLASLLLSMSIILTRFFSHYIGIMGAEKILRFDLGHVIIIFAGIILGPLYGMIIGGLADFLGAIMFPVGAYYFGFTISSMLVGLIPGLIFMIYKKSSWFQKHSLLILLFYQLLILTLVAILLQINIGNEFFSKPKITLTWQINLIFMASLTAFFAVIWGLAYYFEKIKKDRKAAVIILIVLTVNLLVNIPLTSYWLMQFFSVPYHVALVPRIILLLPYMIIPMILLRLLCAVWRH